LSKIWVNFDEVWAKIKTLHPQKHLNSYSYGFIHSILQFDFGTN